MQEGSIQEENQITERQRSAWEISPHRSAKNNQRRNFVFSRWKTTWFRKLLNHFVTEPPTVKQVSLFVNFYR